MAEEIWERFDMMEFLGQLGVLRSPGSPRRRAPPRYKTRHLAYSSERMEGGAASGPCYASIPACWRWRLP
jgi:hypothetical protein